MIGTHNSMTGYPAKCRVSEWLHPLWRCQSKTILQQLIGGVKYFDIRVRYDRHGNLIFCHGWADINTDYWDMANVIRLLKGWGCHCRILIDRGEDKGLINYLETNFPVWRDVVEFIALKKGWKILHNADPRRAIADYSYVPFLSSRSIWWNLRHATWSTIKRWAGEHNPRKDYVKISADSITHFMDHYDLYDDRGEGER